MIYHRYPLRSLMWDYGRAAVGLGFTLVPLLLGNPGLFFTILLGSVAMLFFLYGLRTANQQFTAFELRPDGIMGHGLRRRFFGWDDLSTVHLRYYSTHRDKSRRDLERGWMELKLTAPAGKLRIDSELDGFATILKAVSDTVDRRHLELDETSQENFKVFRQQHGDTADGGQPGDGTGSG